MKNLENKTKSTWRKPTAIEKKKFSKALESSVLKLGRPAKKSSEKYLAISIKLDPKIIKWAKAEAKKRNIGYQTVINEELLKKAS